MAQRCCWLRGARRGVSRRAGRRSSAWGVGGRARRFHAMKQARSRRWRAPGVHALAVRQEPKHGPAVCGGGRRCGLRGWGRAGAQSSPGGHSHAAGTHTTRFALHPEFESRTGAASVRSHGAAAVKSQTARTSREHVHDGYGPDALGHRALPVSRRAAVAGPKRAFEMQKDRIETARALQRSSALRPQPSVRGLADSLEALRGRADPGRPVPTMSQTSRPAAPTTGETPSRRPDLVRRP